VLGSASLVAAGLAMVVLYGFLTGFFLLVVLPRSRVADLRVPRIQRAWLFSVAIYVLVLAPLTAVGTALL
jgi:hypothetical protein